MKSGYCVATQSGLGKNCYCDTFEAAERLAAVLIHERDTGRGTTWCTIHGPLTSEAACAVIAYVRLDALGRIWTDRASDGTQLDLAGLNDLAARPK